MKKAICHYSFHRRWKAENWNVHRLCDEVSSLGIEGIDFHAGLLGLNASEITAVIREALRRSNLIFSGFSLSNDFNQEDAESFYKQIEETKKWITVAAEVQAPVARIFGGHLPAEERQDADRRASAYQRILDGLGQAVKEAERHGLILALENHGGLPCTAEEQVGVIDKIGSKNLKATVDVGNYMQCGQEGHAGTRLAAPYAAYVHFKDFRKMPADSNPWGWSTEACILGKGDVDHRACLKELKKAGYNGFVALEYEGPDEESMGVPESVRFMKEVWEEL
ncbi:sugar phosphate isomerase/epimerase [bacterium]|nr:sugar phosphate isomerase/epimerase [bacterium]